MSAPPREGLYLGDPEATPRPLAAGTALECEHFRKQLEIRTTARKAFVSTDNDQAIRRALLRRSCPARGPFSTGQLVMYWRCQSKANRREGGRWHGPARFVFQPCGCHMVPEC